MNGTIFLVITLAGSLLAALLYALPSDKFDSLKWTEKFRAPSLFIAALGAILASIVLIMLIFQNDVSYAYVVSYSSKDLSAVYKLSAFWAGQQGSFLLWLFIHAVASVVLYKQKKIDNTSMAVYMLVQAVLVILVLAKSPFAPQENPVDDGIGLNPLLQDPWMAVHPPIIFVGYALLAVPFAMSMGALFTKNLKIDWLENARKWTLVAWSFLGAGIFIGGYWAYKVLGWGGFWGWDPVENSSLVPWLVAGILLHLIKVAKIRQTVLPVMHLSAIFTFSLVIYGTFLTRSGLLGDFSVHSFSGESIGLVLAIVNAVILVVGLFILTIRANIFPKGEMYPSYDSREFLLLLGALVLAFVASVIFLGMSMPLITDLMGHPAAVDTSFYIRTTLPLAILFSVVMIFSVLRFYGDGKSLPKTFLPLILGIVSVILAVLVGVYEILPLVLVFVSIVMGASSVFAYKNSAISFGGMIAHLGLAIAFFAIILSGNGGRHETVEFAANETKEILGHSVTYEGQEFLKDGSAKYYKYKVDGNEIKALTKLRKNGTDAAREPAIYKGVTGDVYIAPNPPEDTGIGELTLKRWEIALDGDFAYIFEEVEVTETDPDHLLAVARISVTDGKIDDVAEPSLLVSKTSGVSDPVEILGGKKRIRLTGVSENQKKVRIEIIPSVEEMSNVPITANISTKPYIWLLWLGVIMVVLGTMTAIKKSVKNPRK